jgi:antirestriction protein ArdC
VGELGTAFLRAGLDISVTDKGNHANYNAYWLEILKHNKRCILTVASEDLKAIHCYSLNKTESAPIRAFFL